MITIITASHNREILENNLLKSPIAQNDNVLTMMGYTNIPEAYNAGMENFPVDYLMFSHHDVFIPATFEAELQFALKTLPEDWAVAGVAGVSMINGVRKLFGFIDDRGRDWGSPITDPVPVQTLDELLIIVNMKHGLRFDEQFEQDFYSCDLCMQAHERDLGVYVIPGYVHHNSSRKVGERTPSFFESQEKFRKKWFRRLDIATTCAIIKK